MPQDLQEIAATSPEDIQIAGVRIALHRFLNLQRQAIHPPAHVGGTDRKPDPHATRNRDHRRSRTPMTRAKAAALTSRSTITRLPPVRSISGRPERRRAETSPTLVRCSRGVGAG